MDSTSLHQSNGISIIRQQETLQQIKEKFELLSQEIQAETSPELYQKLRLKFDDILNDFQPENGSISPTPRNPCEFNTKDKIKTKPGNYLPKKVFTPRNSLITELWDNKHISTIYYIFLAMLFGLFIHTVVHDLIRKGTMKLGFGLIILSFANIHKVLFIWVCMFATTTFSIYGGMYMWTKVRKTTKDCAKWDGFCCILYVSYVFCFVYYYTCMVTRYQITTAEAIGALTEMTRFLMKSHAFVRSSVPDVIQHNQTKQFTRFLYFLFAPTLVYQDAYLRTNNIRWKYVVLCFAELLGCMLYLSFLYEHFLVPDFENFGIVEYKWQNVILLILGNGIGGTLMLLCTFYALLHSWHNGFAEMLRFADRMFYKDWWTSASFGRFYTTWNVVVQDWLYTYIYKDFYEIVAPNNKFVAKFMVFFTSALAHEYILGFGFGFCFPILFILFFVFGFAVSSVRVKYEWVGNFGLWYGLSLGMAIAMSMYCMEFYARRNCRNEDVSIISYFIPKSVFGCNL